MTGIRELLEHIDGISKYSTKTINQANLVLVSSTIDVGGFQDVVYACEKNPSKTSVLRLESRVGGKNTFQQIDSAMNRNDVQKMFAYLHKDEFDNIASNYQNSNYKIFGITEKLD